MLICCLPLINFHKVKTNITLIKVYCNSQLILGCIFVLMIFPHKQPFLFAAHCLFKLLMLPNFSGRSWPTEHLKKKLYFGGH